MSPDDLIGDSPDNLYGAALSMFGLVQQRKAGDPRRSAVAVLCQKHAHGDDEKPCE